MSGSENTRWVAVSALGAAMFAIGFSFVGVACSTRDVSVSEVAHAADSVAVPAPAASLGEIAKVVNAPTVAPVVIAPATSSAPVAAASSSANATIDQASDGLKLKRIVVTRKIENREPVAGSDFNLGNAPVYAFVELENSAKDARNIRVLFQNEDTKASVGHVKLTVPADQARFRTWGNTRMIRDPGHWVAVVSTVDGVELGRAPFEVKG
jgi:Protein of unknown function (DUF2914)